MPIFFRIPGPIHHLPSGAVERWAGPIGVKDIGIAVFRSYSINVLLELVEEQPEQGPASARRDVSALC
jgi:hypothetical protein